MAGAARLEAFRAQIAPIAAITLFGLSISLSQPLFGLLLERMGASGTAIGFNHAATAISTVVFAPVMPAILARLGLARLMVWSTLLMAATLLAAGLWHDFWFWMAMRVAFGFAGTVLFFGSEYWIVAAAPDAARGRVVAIYSISVSGAFLAGPLVLAAVGIDGIAPFAVAAALTLLGLPPILWGRASAPDPGDAAPASPAAAVGFFRSDPSIVWGVALFGMIEFGVLGLVPVWAVRSGLSEGQAVVLLALFAFGGMVLQWPIGWAADRLNRRVLMIAGGGACLAMPLTMIAAAPALPWLWVAMFVWGGLSVALYTVALTEVGARYRGVRLSEANAAIILAYGIGALAAPVALGLAMDAVPPDGLLWLSAAVAGAYALLLVLRWGRRPADSA
ncbi:MAG TPA: MFS transporter [Thermohalobaculum sp.]|nr:MFS transporter [Thermohalobaculum sp.]